MQTMRGIMCVCVFSERTLDWKIEDLNSSPCSVLN